MKKCNVVGYFAKKYLFKEIICGLLLILFILVSLISPMLMQYFVDEILPSKDMKNVYGFGAVFAGIYLIIATLAVIIKYVITDIENNIITDIRYIMFKNLVYQPIEYYNKSSMSMAIERIVRDAEVVRSLWGFLFPSVFTSVLTFSISFIIIFSKSKQIALLSLAAILAYVFIFRFYNEKLRNLYMRARKDIDGINACLSDAWGGAKEIKIFQFENPMISKFLSYLKILKRDNVNMNIKDEYSKQLMSLATILGTLTTLIVGGYLVIKNELTLGMLLALQTYVSKLYSPAQDIADMAVDYKKYTVNISRLSEIFFLESEEAEEKEFSKKLNGEINFDKVSFSYGDNKVINNMSFSLPENGIVALVGKSGAGKSTVINMIMGFVKPNNGIIRIGNTNIAELHSGELRSNISLVSQDTYMFNAGIYDNIKLGNPKASENEIREVVEKLGINNIVNNYPNKLDTIVSEFGKNLSGGQIQRISIARALLKKVPIIIFDEATSNIDSETEQLIHSILEELKETTLIVIVSHRLSSLKNADKILMLENGTIIEEGTINQLKTKNTAFTKLFKDQLFEEKS